MFRWSVAIAAAGLSTLESTRVRRLSGQWNRKRQQTTPPVRTLIEMIQRYLWRPMISAGRSISTPTAGGMRISFFFLVVVEMLSLFLFVSPRQRSVSFRNFEPPIRSNEKETIKVSRSVNRFKRLFKRDRERKHQKKRQLWNELNGTHLHCCVIDWERKTARVSPDRCQELGCLEKKKSSRKNVHRVPRTADRWRCAAISIDTSSSKPFHNKSMR